jgi:uncharacterized membrane protein (DUF4010 family)
VGEFSDMDPGLFGQVGIALMLGLLIGLQRQRAESAIGGIRTFPLIAAFGTICGWLAQAHGGWVIAAGLVGVAALLVMSNFMLARGGDHDPGQTTEIAALLLYGIGAYLVSGEAAVAVALGGVIAVLLHFKDPLHAFAARIGERDVTAIMQFVLISLVVLPVLPNQTYGPYDTLNPFQTWLMVVLIVGISLVGYVAYKLLGERQGALLGGVVGGLASSTATTVSFARRAAAAPGSAAIAALVIMIASSVVYARVIAEVTIVAPSHISTMLPPLVAMLFACAVIAVALAILRRERKAAAAEQGNPANLRLAVTFAALYALISFVVTATQAEFGVRALIPVALLSGLTDMDAITLSSSQLVSDGRLDADTAWRMIVLASLSNLLFKGGMAAVIGGRELVKHLAPAFAAALLAGAGILWLWPSSE